MFFLLAHTCSSMHNIYVFKIHMWYTVPRNVFFRSTNRLCRHLISTRFSGCDQQRIGSKLQTQKIPEIFVMLVEQQYTIPQITMKRWYKPFPVMVDYCFANTTESCSNSISFREVPRCQWTTSKRHKFCRCTPCFAVFMRINHSKEIQRVRRSNDSEDLTIQG